MNIISEIVTMCTINAEYNKFTRWKSTVQLFILLYALVLHPVDSNPSQSNLCRRKKCDPPFPAEHSGKCVQSTVSSRKICYPDLFELDYTCAARYDRGQRSITPPVVSNGQYKSLTTKFRLQKHVKSLKAYLAVQYQCNAGYQFLDESEYLFCSKENWLGTPPICVPTSMIDEYRLPGNPCVFNHAGCSHVCHFLGKNVTECQCPDGYKLSSDLKTCQEAQNICDLDNGGCSHYCTEDNSDRGYRCSCPQNYVLDKDGHNCKRASLMETDNSALCGDVPYGYPNGDCIDTCQMNQDCRVGEYCCWNGCSQVCFQPVSDLPICEDSDGCDCSSHNLTHYRCDCKPQICLMSTFAPTVSITPSRRLEIKPESEVNVTCTAKGFPTPTLKWYKDSVLVTNKQELKLISPSTLILKLSNVSKTMTLRCEVVNDLGMASSQLEVFVPGPGSPPSNIKSSIEGTKVKITWQAPNGIVDNFEIYYVETEDVGSKPNGRWSSIKTDQEEITLQLNPMATYYIKIRALNRYGPGPFSPVFFVVTESSESRPFVKIDQGKEAHIPPGGSIDLKCLASGIPTPIIAWYKKGKLLQSNAEPSTTMQIKVEGLVETTEFQCVAENKMGRSTASIQVSVLGPGSPPENIKYRLSDGVNVKIEWDPPRYPNGNISGYAVHFTENAEEPLELWEVIVTGINRSAEVTSLNPWTKYTFGIRAFNVFGPGPLSPQFSLNTTQQKMKPSITLHPSTTVFIAPGGSINISCTSSGYPVPYLRWTKEDEEIQTTFQPETNNDDLETTKLLVIEEIYETSTFVCTAENSVGIESKEIDVDVTGPGTSPNNFEANSSGRNVHFHWEPPTIQNGKIVDYVIYISDDPNQPLSNWKEYTVGSDSLESLITLDPNTVYYAKIAGVTALGTGVLSEPLIFETVEHAPEVIIEPGGEVLQVEIGSIHEITCIATGNPPPLVIWYKNGQEMKSWKMSADDLELDDPSFVLTVGELTDNVLLKCEAENDVGKAFKTITLVVLGAGSPPDNIRHSVIGNKVLLRWNEPKHKTGKIKYYNISYAHESETEPRKWNSIKVPGHRRQYQINDLLPDKSYLVKLAAVGENGISPFSEPIRVTLHPKEFKPVVSIDPALHEYFLQFGEQININCTAQGVPPPKVSWYRGGERITNIENAVMLSEEPQESTEYECIAFNKLGSSSVKVAVIINDKTNLPVNVRANAEGTTVNVSWQSESPDDTLQAFVVHFTNDSGIPLKMWYQLVEPAYYIEQKNYSVSLEDLAPDTLYFIRIRALTDNGMGPLSEIAEVITSVKPENSILAKTIPESEVEVPFGGSAVVHCLGIGEPTPSVTLQTDDIILNEPLLSEVEYELKNVKDKITLECTAVSDAGVAYEVLTVIPSDVLTENGKPAIIFDNGNFYAKWSYLDPDESLQHNLYTSMNAQTPLELWDSVDIDPVERVLPLNSFEPGSHVYYQLQSFQSDGFQIKYPISRIDIPKLPESIQFKQSNGKMDLKISDFKLPTSNSTTLHVLLTDDLNEPMELWFNVLLFPNKQNVIESVPNISPNKTYYVQFVAMKNGIRQLLSDVYNVTSPPLDDRCKLAGCEHTCRTYDNLENELHSVKCECFAGYTLNPDLKTCFPIMAASVLPEQVKDNDEACTLPSEQLKCSGTNEGWYFDPTVHDCVLQKRSGCDSNSFEFQNRLDCMDSCSETLCHKMRREHFLQRNVEAYLPECDENGDFDSLQCHQHVGECWCVDSNSGKEIAGTKKSISEELPVCKGCIHQLDDVLSAYQNDPSINFHKPRCTEDGFYDPLQCSNDDNECWCVDEETGDEIEGTRSSELPLFCENQDDIQPENVQAIIKNSSIYLKWNMSENSAVKKYYIYYTQNPDDPVNKWYVVVLYSPMDKTEFKLMNAALPKANYAIKVKPVFANGGTGRTSAVSFVNSTFDPPSKPANIRLEKVTDRLATLTWDRPLDWDETDTKVVVYTTDLTTGKKMQSSELDEHNSHTLELSPESSYTVTLAAINEYGETTLSDAITFQTDPSGSLRQSTDLPVQVTGFSTEPKTETEDTVHPKELLIFEFANSSKLAMPNATAEFLSNATFDGVEDDNELDDKFSYETITDDDAETSIDAKADDSSFSGKKQTNRKSAYYKGKMSEKPSKKRPHSSRVDDDKAEELEQSLPETSSEDVGLHSPTSMPETEKPVTSDSNLKNATEEKLKNDDENISEENKNFEIFHTTLMPVTRSLFGETTDVNLNSELPHSKSSESQLEEEFGRTDEEQAHTLSETDKSINTTLFNKQSSASNSEDVTVQPTLPHMTSLQVTTPALTENDEGIVYSTSDFDLQKRPIVINEPIELKRISALDPSYSGPTTLMTDTPSIWQGDDETTPGFVDFHLTPKGNNRGFSVYWKPEKSSPEIIDYSIWLSEGKHEKMPADVKQFRVPASENRFNFETNNALPYTVWMSASNSNGEGPLSKPKHWMRNRLSRPSDTTIKRGHVPKWTPVLISAKPTDYNAIDVEWIVPRGRHMPRSDLMILYSSDPEKAKDKWKAQAVRSNQDRKEVLHVPDTSIPYHICLQFRNQHGSGRLSNCMLTKPYNHDADYYTTVNGYTMEDLSNNTPFKNLNNLLSGTITSEENNYPPSWTPDILFAEMTAPDRATVYWEVPESKTSSSSDLLLYYSDDPSKSKETWPHVTANSLVDGESKIRFPNTGRKYTICGRIRNAHGFGPFSNCIVATPYVHVPRRNIRQYEFEQFVPNYKEPIDQSSFSKHKPRVVPFIKSIKPLTAENMEIKWKLPDRFIDSNEDFIIFHTDDPGKPLNFWDTTAVLPSSSDDSSSIVKAKSDKPFAACMRARNIYGLGPLSNCVRTKTSRNRGNFPFYSTIAPEAEQHSNNFTPIPIYLSTSDTNADSEMSKEEEYDYPSTSAGWHSRKGTTTVSPSAISDLFNTNRPYIRLPGKMYKKDPSAAVRENQNSWDAMNNANELSLAEKLNKPIADHHHSVSPLQLVQRKDLAPMQSNHKTENDKKADDCTNWHKLIQSLPQSNVSVVPTCNCTCKFPSDSGEERRCFYENMDTDVDINANFGDMDQLSSITVTPRMKITPVPPGMEEECSCVKPKHGNLCPPGYLLKKNKCYDIDECSYRNGGCSHGCVNTPGNYYCACPYGMVKDPENPFQCVNVDSMFNKISKLFSIYIWDKLKQQSVPLERITASSSLSSSQLS